MTQDAYEPKQRILAFRYDDTEIQTIGWCFELFDDLPDNDARQRVAEYLFRKYVSDRKDQTP